MSIGNAGMDPTGKILAWAAEQTAWLQDALRRLTQSRSLSEADRADIVQMVKAQYGLVDPEAVPKPVPLGPDHLIDTSEHAVKLQLVSLGDVEHANDLATGQILPFCASLTVVYGENASGKSGYVRIMKNAAGARGWERHPVRPNLFKVLGSTNPLPRATLYVNLGDAAVKALEWVDQTILPDLKRVRVFDTRTAAIYVGSEAISFF